VWTHGDFKIENLLIATETRRICGLIDWDLSEDPGLPLVDLLYFLVFNRMLLGSQKSGDVLVGELLPGSFTPDETTLIEEYSRRLGLPGQHVFPLVAMFWIHHITRRLGPGNPDSNYPEWVHANVARILARLVAAA
jgi:aminoglycoside phosphotransferase (APT) family kinase protein